MANKNLGGYKGTGKYGIYDGIEYLAPDAKNPYGSTRPVVKETPPKKTQSSKVSTPSFASSSGNLKQGTKNDDTGKLQTSLNTLGAKLKVDNDFGNLTKQAVIDFQKKSGLVADGIVGVETTKALNKALSEYKPPKVTADQPDVVTTTPPANTTTNIKQGMVGENIKQLQTLLNQAGAKLKVDGSFGPATKSAVMAFQQANGLTVDGIIGTQTQAALDKAITSGGIITDAGTRGGTTQAPDDPSFKYNTKTGELNPNNKEAQKEIADINTKANSEQDELLESFKDKLGTKVDVSDSAEIIKTLTESFKDKGEEKKTSLVDVLSEKRKELQVGEKETELADVNSEIAKLDNSILELFGDEEDKLRSVTQINRRKSEEQKLYERERSRLLLKKQTITNELDAKYSVIDTLMKYTAADYENAQQDYQTKFNQGIQLTNLLKNVEETAKSDAEKKSDNARANLQIMLNTLKDKNVDFNTLDSGTLLNIKNLETQSGLPQGFMKFAMEATDEPVVSMGSEFTNASGQRQVPVYTKNPSTGAIGVKIITLGTADKSSGDETKSEDDAIATGVLGFETLVKKNNWKGIDPTMYKQFTDLLQSEYGSDAVLKFRKKIEDAGLMVDEG